MPISERKILKNFLVKGQNVAAVFTRQKKDKRKSNSTRQKNETVYSKVESNASPEIPDGRRHQTSPASLRGYRRKNQTTFNCITIIRHIQ